MRSRATPDEVTDPQDLVLDQLSPGDVVEVHIPGVGTLCNRIVPTTAGGAR